MSLQHDFERYLRHELPMKLNLSPSKQVACDGVFYHFSDFAKDLATKSPDEFRCFFDEFKNRVERINKWKCQRTHVIAPKLTTDTSNTVGIAKTAGGKIAYAMYPKKGVEPDRKNGGKEFD